MISDPATTFPALLMETGRVGARGQLAADHVNPGYKFEREVVQSHCLNMAGRSVQERQTNSANATLIHAQSTVVGLPGLCQNLAVFPVAVEQRYYHALAPIQRQNMAENFVKETQERNKCAPAILVQSRVVGPVGLY